MMDKDNILRRLVPVFNDALMRDDVDLKPEYSAPDVEGWDSLRHIDIILTVEQDFNIKFSTRELDAMQTVGDLVDTIASKTQA